MAETMTGQSEIEMLKLQNESLTKQFGKVLLEKEKIQMNAKAGVQEEIEKGKKDCEALEAQLKKGAETLKACQHKTPEAFINPSMCIS